MSIIPRHVHFGLLYIQNGPLIQVLITNQMHLYFTLVCGSNFLQLGPNFCQNAQEKEERS